MTEEFSSKLEPFLDEGGDSSTVDENPDVSPDPNLAQSISPGDSGNTGEKTREDRQAVGLAMSGGGIRSAAFNLGVLYGLSKSDILERISYVASVSGGGFAAGFWMRWLHCRTENSNLPFFPKFEDNQDAHSREALCRLRKYANYLAPRPGVFTKDGLHLWLQAVPMVLSSLFLVSCLFLGICSLIWFGTYFTESHWPFHTSWSSVGTEGVSNATEPFDPRDFLLSVARNLIRPETAIPLVPGAGCALVLLFISIIQHFSILFSGKSLEKWLKKGSERFGRWTFWCLVLGSAYILGRATSAAITDQETWKKGWLLGAVFVEIASTTIVPTLLFIGRHFILKQKPADHRKKFASWFNRLTLHAIRFAPVLIVFSAMALITTFAFEAHEWFNPHSDPGLRLLLSLLPLIVLIISLFLFFPNRNSLHPLFQNRVVRAFLFSALAGEKEGKGKTDPADWDINLATMTWQEGKPGRPLHLICATANDIHSDSLDGYNQGGKSVVFSREGLLIEDEPSIDGQIREPRPWSQKEVNRIKLGTVLTASAAAFNSQMGRYTVQLGKNLAFLLAAFNFRLGLWIKREDKWSILYLLPGLRFYTELFSLTKVKGRNYVHVSDGGHFENLGLYELVRRKCKYIIVTEAGTDPEEATTDLGYTLWRIQAELGVRVEIDTAGFSPNEEGLSERHVAVGTVHYSDVDLGVLIYLRTGVSGDEPVEVKRYRSSNPSFPYESTADQFFEPEQWDAYRALGTHIAEVAFEFLKTIDGRDRSKKNPLGGTLSISRIFETARWTWNSLPAHIERRLGKIDLKQEAFLADFMRSAPPKLAREIYPEIGQYETMTCKDVGVFDFEKEYFWVRRVALFVQMVWREAELGRYYRYPALRHWGNLIDRWARTEVVQISWPILKPLLDSGFVQFLESATDHKLSHGWAIWLDPENLDTGTTSVGLNIRTWRPDGEQHSQKIGRVENLSIKTANGIADVRWNYRDFNIDKEFQGAGLGTHSLREVVNGIYRLAKGWKPDLSKIRITVTLDDQFSKGDPADRQSLERFYREAEFYPDPNKDEKKPVFVYTAEGLDDPISIWVTTESGGVKRKLELLDATRLSKKDTLFFQKGGEVSSPCLGTLTNPSVSGNTLSWHFLDFETLPEFRRKGWGTSCIEKLKQKISAEEIALEVDVTERGDHPFNQTWPLEERFNFYRKARVQVINEDRVREMIDAGKTHTATSKTRVEISSTSDGKLPTLESKDLGEACREDSEKKERVLEEQIKNAFLRIQRLEEFEDALLDLTEGEPNRNADGFNARFTKDNELTFYLFDENAGRSKRIRIGSLSNIHLRDRHNGSFICDWRSDYLHISSIISEDSKVRLLQLAIEKICEAAPGKTIEIDFEIHRASPDADNPYLTFGFQVTGESDSLLSFNQAWPPADPEEKA